MRGRNGCDAGRNERLRGGQVVVEVLLILPVFLFLVFMIMEIGHLAFRAILVHHAAYEVGRIGSLTIRNDQASAGCVAPVLDMARMRAVGTSILPGSQVDAAAEPTLADPQSGGCNHDVVVTVRQAVPLVMPLTGLVLGTPRGARQRRLQAEVRMPIEMPVFK